MNEVKNERYSRRTITFLRFLFLVLICLIMTMTAQAGASGIVTGTCGDNISWTLDKSSGVLTLSGTGDIKDYTMISGDINPWFDDSFIVTM